MRGGDHTSTAFHPPVCSSGGVEKLHSFLNMLQANAKLAKGTTAIQAAQHIASGDELIFGSGWARTMSTVKVERTRARPRQSKNGMTRVSETGIRDLGTSEPMERMRVMT
jgi:hypothetical protein